MKALKEYELIQQTPIIHFQGKECGATLRATEVKPKLDRYILKNFPVKKEWYLGNEAKKTISENDSRALNYKIRIEAQGVQNPLELGIKTPYDIYYGNLGQDKKYGVIADKIKFTIVCTNEELRETIDKCLEGFFFVTNFGTMQNKGFGSFTVKKKGDGRIDEKKLIDSLKKECGSNKVYRFETKSEEIFTNIKTLYSIMKSGVNFRGYQRSLLFLFMHEKCGIRNDKAWLKQEGLAPAICKGINDKGFEDRKRLSGEKAYYVRALLGVGDHIDFLNDTENKKDKTSIKISSVGKEIDRSPSSVFFKVVKIENETYVYYTGKSIDNRVYGKKFEFTSKKLNTGSFIPQKNTGTLNIPGKQELEDKLKKPFIEAFLDYCYHKMSDSNIKKFFNGGKGLEVKVL